MQAGQLQMDFRTVLRRVRALDVTVLNRGQPRSGSLQVFNPAREQIGRRAIEVAENRVEILSLRSDQPYHYAELAMADGCFLGFSLTPPTPAREPGAPRAAVATSRATPAATLVATDEALRTGCTPLADGDGIEESIASSGDEDCFVFEGAAGDRVTVFVDNRTTGGRQGITVRLLKPDGSRLADDFEYGNPEIREQVLPEGGVYTIVVDGYDNTTGSYTLSLEFTARGE
ncbi:MAG: PPC domain-containing protein [Anaerolineae bacterium]